MVEFEEYPHIITSQAIAGEQVEPYQDANGDWVIPESLIDTVQSVGRARPNDAGKLIVGEDGSAVAFGFIVYMPQDAPEFISGSPVVMTGVGTGSVKRFFRGQLNCQMWV